MNAETPNVPPKRPSRWWYGLAFAIFLVSLVPALIIAVSLADKVSGYGITAIENGDTITIDGNRKAIYIDESLVGGVPAGIECALTPTNGGDRILTVRPFADLQINDWERIAQTPEGTPPGDYELRCQGTGTATLGISDNPDIANGLVKAFLVLAFPVGGAMVAIIIIVIVAVLRHRAPPPSAGETRHTT